MLDVGWLRSRRNRGLCEGLARGSRDLSGEGREKAGARTRGRASLRGMETLTGESDQAQVMRNTNQLLMICAPCRGQYSDAVLNELESQNNDQVEGIMGKVRQLKGVC